MNTKNLLIASIIGGLVSTALSNIPFVNLVNCLLCAGFWAGPFLAVWLYARQSAPMSLGQGVLVGTLAGLWAGVFGFLLSFLGLAGIAPLVQTYTRFMPSDAQVELPPPGLASVLFNLMGVFVNVAFGAIGGLIGGAIFKSKPAIPPEIR